VEYWEHGQGKEDGEMLISVFGGLFGLLLPVLLIVGVVYLVRSKGSHEGPTIYDALAAYFYTIIGASMITAAIGAILFIGVALKGWDSGHREEIALASTLLGTGVFIGLLHLAGKVLIQRRGNKTFAGIRRVYLFTMLGTASLAGLVSLPLAIYSVVNHYVAEHPYYHHEDFPATQTAVAIVVVPLWCYYLYRVIRESARRNKDGDSSPTTTT
jgi:hypothetical protein